MKGLFHSKRFRKNLGKWLFMYVGIMILLTTVITYSKYVSKLMATDSARPAKFDVSVAAQNCTDPTSDGIHCNIGKNRATKTIDYYFKLNTNLEVKTNLFLTIMVNQRFTLEKIEEVGKEESITDFDTKSQSIYVDGNVETYTVYSLKAITYQAEDESKQEKLYKVTVKFKNQAVDDYGNVDSNKNYDIVRVGYSAIQLNK